MDNEKFLDCFCQPMEAEGWALTIEEHVAPWVEAKSKSFWELVMFVSKQRGVIKKSLGRERFGELLIAMCPHAVDVNDT